VEAAWLERTLALAGSLEIDTIRAVRAQRIGEGYGLDGTIARLTLTDGKGREDSVVAKWCRAELGRREARFYREIAPQMDVRLAGLRAFAEQGDVALLLLEDLSPARQGDALVGAAPREAERLFDVAARVHRRFWQTPADSLVAWLPRWGADPGGEAERTHACLPRFREWFGTRLAPAARQAAEGLPESLLGAHATLAGAPVTLIHRDLHLDNVLFAPAGEPIVIDWTHVALGPSVVDVIRLLTEALDGHTRRGLTRPLLARYRLLLANHGAGYEAADFREHLHAALLVLFAGAVRFKEPGPASHARLLPVIENLVRNVAALVEDGPECLG
jgi:hypothetical protein